MEFYLAPVGAGKTEYVQRRLIDLKRRSPFAKAWALLATERQIVDFRRRLMDSADSRVYFNIEFYNFYSLYSNILMIARESQRRLTDAARYGVIRRVLTDLKQSGALPIYGTIAETTGFVRIIADFIYELKQSVVDHESFAASALQLGDDPKLRELAAIYAAYQHVLVENKLVDREGEGWVALSELARDPNLGSEIDLLVVDGYDQFNPLQARLLTVLASRVKESVVTLTTVPGRENTVGRRFARALDSLIRCHDEENHPYTITRAEPRSVTGDSEINPIYLLADRIFALNATPHTQATNAITFIEAPDPAQEASAILRRIKKLLLEGCKPDDILIAVRDWTMYGAHFTALGRVYGLPLLLQSGDPLMENPAILALVNLLELHEKDFRRRDLLDALRSPYVKAAFLDDDGARHLDALSRAAMITGGRGVWLDAIHQAGGQLSGTHDSDDESAAPYTMDRVSADLLRAALEMFFNGVTPPITATIQEFVRWIEDLIGDEVLFDPDEGEEPTDNSEQIIRPQLHSETSSNGKEYPTPPYTISMFASIRENADLRLVGGIGVVERDLAAINEFKSALRGMISAETLLHAIGKSADEPITWNAFWKQLKTSLAARHIRLIDTGGLGRDGRVLVTTVNEARGLPHKHVFIPGLSESIFPAPVAEDPLLLDSERLRLAAVTGVDLAITGQRADDDGLFYELLNLAGESLTFTRPTLKDGAPVPESHLWRAAKRILPNAAKVRLRLGAVIPYVEIATPHEAAVAAAEAFTQNGDQPNPLAAWLSAAHPDYWTRISNGRWIEANRISRFARYDQHAGRLQSEISLARVSDQLGENRIWSATQLNEYGICPFRFFASRLLHLEKHEEPEEGLNTRQLGTLYHEILEATYKRIANQNGTISADNLDDAVAILQQEADRLLPNAPRRIGFRRSALWDQEQNLILRRLENFVRADFGDKNPIRAKFGDAPRTPYKLEASFGGDFRLRLGDTSIRVRGIIDRIDRQGDRLIVMDYKTGSTPIPTQEISDGRNFQMMLYLRAAEAMIAEESSELPSQVAGGVFIHLSSLEGSGALKFDAEGLEIIKAGEEHLARYIERGRAGDFAVDSNKVENGRCAHYCDYHQFCRAAVINRRKLDTR